MALTAAPSELPSSIRSRTGAGAPSGAAHHAKASATAQEAEQSRRRDAGDSP